MLPYEYEDHGDRGVTMQGKQAKIVSPTQERAILGHLATTRYPAREGVSQVWMLCEMSHLNA